jgi:phospholipase C
MGGKPDARDSGGHRDASADAGTPSDGGVDSGYIVPDAWNQTYVRPSDDAAAASRAACTFARGAMPAQTTGPGTALDTEIPIEHVVVLMQENRSFDSYLGHLQAYEATKGINNTIESAPANASNPSFPVDQADAALPDGGFSAGDAGADAAPTGHPWQHATQLCFFDTQHGWGAAHIENDHGLNDGFYFINNGTGDTGESTKGISPAQLSGERAMWWYDQTDLPFDYDLYSTFAMGDHYFSALLGPTYPNRMYLYSGTSFGLTTNVFPSLAAYPTPETPAIIFDELSVRGISWTLYAEGAPGAGVVLGLSADSRYGRNPVAKFAQFLTDAQAGNLPAVSFVDGDNENETTSGDDEHPPSEIQIGQHFVWEVVNAVTTSPNWKNTVLFVTYDENGGIYDHVSPPPACEPDGIQPVLTDSLDQSQPGSFNQYGFRVPFVAVSPYSKKSYVSHTTYSHTSITRFIEAKFKLPAMTVRDANADPFTDLFDWQNPPFMTAPVFSEPTINQAAVTTCTSELTADGG